MPAPGGRCRAGERVPGRRTATLLGEGDARLVGIAPEQRGSGAERLDRFRAGAFAQHRDQLPPPLPVGRSEADLDQFVVVQGLLQLPDDGVGEAALPEPHDGLAAMGLSTQEGDLGPAEHEASRVAERRASLAREVDATLAAIKCEVAAILVVALVGAPFVIGWLDGVRAAVVLGGYGLGAGLWIHVRVRGLLLALRRARAAAGSVS